MRPKDFLSFPPNRRKLKPNQSTVAGLEGQYYLKVFSPNWSRNTRYTIALKKLDLGQELASPSAEKQNQKIKITDIWPIEARKSAILLGAGSSQDLKTGQILKIFRSGRFLDVCKIVGVGPTESECHIARQMKEKDQLSARRSL